MSQFSSNQSAVGAVTIGAAAGVIRLGSVRGSLLVRNNHATNILYLGKDSTVTTADGFPVAAGESVRLEGFTGNLYGIASGAGTDVRFLELG